MELLRLDLIVPVSINLSEGRVNVLVSKGDMDMVSLEEALQEHAKLFSVQMVITIAIELSKILFESFCQLSVILVKFNKLAKSFIEFTGGELFRIDHHFYEELIKFR